MITSKLEKLLLNYQREESDRIFNNISGAFSAEKDVIFKCYNWCQVKLLSLLELLT